MEILNSPLDHNHRHGAPLYSKNIQEAVSRVMEEEEKYAKQNVNSVIMDPLFQSLVTINTQSKDANLKNERRIALGIHAETMK